MAPKSRVGARTRSKSTEPLPVRSPGMHISGPAGSYGSGVGIPEPHCKFLPRDKPVPVALHLQLDAPAKGGTAAGREQLNRPVLLIHAQDPAFACCWFSRAIDLGDESGNPAFWMLQKTAKDIWALYLRRVSGEIAAYHLKTKTKHFPIKMKKGRVTKEFQWPKTITISQGG